MYYKIGLLRKIRQHLDRGGVIAYPTESCFGFGCDPFNYKAIQKVIKLKRRNKNKGLIVIAGKIAQLNSLVKPLTGDDLEYASTVWPGPYSLVIRSKKNVQPNLVGKHNKIAVRVTKHKLVAQLCNYLNMPLVSTSANRSSFKSIRSYKECIRQFADAAMVLPGVISYSKKPSTIVDLETKVILR